MISELKKDFSDICAEISRQFGHDSVYKSVDYSWTHLESKVLNVIHCSMDSFDERIAGEGCENHLEFDRYHC